MELYPSPPVVVYPLLDNPGRTPRLSSLEQVCLMASVAMSRMHFTNANLVCTPSWFKYLDSLNLLSLFTSAHTLESDPALGYNLEVFWSTAAKKLGLEWARKTHPYDPVLLMDVDAIIWNADKIAWDDPSTFFVGGYEEPLQWEAYREQRWRLGDLFIKSVGKYIPEQFHRNTAALWTIPPVNGGCMYFSDFVLLDAYIDCLGKFMTGFKERECQPKAFLADKNDPKSSAVYFSEVMMADQRILGVLIHSKYKADEPNGDDYPYDFLTSFTDPDYEYPAPSDAFLHLWKFKAVAAADETQRVIMEQSILLELMKRTEGWPRFLRDLGIHLVVRQVPLVFSCQYIDWIR